MNGKRQPKYGDTVFIRSGMPDGSWVNGIVNGVAKDGGLIVGVRKGAHVSGAQAIIAHEWAWPHEMPGTVQN